MSALDRIGVVVPARDEEEHLGAALAALRGAVATLHARYPAIAVATVVVADACRDGTAEVARRAGVRVIETDAGNVGRARAAGASELLGGPSGHGAPTWCPDRSWLATTDADSEVPAGWLREMEHVAARGADVLVGTVRPHLDELSPVQRRRWLSTHRPGEPNGHVHGANLGVRVSRYLQVGGFAPLGMSEDVDLVERLRAAGAVEVHSDVAEVLTSSRAQGRTTGGYAAHLAALGEDGAA